MLVEKSPYDIRHRIFSVSPALPLIHAARLPDCGPAGPGFLKTRAARHDQSENGTIARCATSAAERKDRP